MNAAAQNRLSLGKALIAFVAVETAVGPYLVALVVVGHALERHRLSLLIHPSRRFDRAAR